MQLVSTTSETSCKRRGRAARRRSAQMQLPLEKRRDRPALGRLVLWLVPRREDAKAVQGSRRDQPRSATRADIAMRKERPARPRRTGFAIGARRLRRTSDARAPKVPAPSAKRAATASARARPARVSATFECRWCHYACSTPCPVPDGPTGEGAAKRLLRLVLRRRRTRSRRASSASRPRQRRRLTSVPVIDAEGGARRARGRRNARATTPMRHRPLPASSARRPSRRGKRRSSSENADREEAS